MQQNFNDLLAFVTVAREGSFTRAAAQLGVSQSALSHTIRGLEAKLGIRLLTRTTRSVSPTDAGERLLTTLGPRFDEIQAEVAALSELRDKPAGTIRISAAEHAADTVLWPKLRVYWRSDGLVFLGRGAKAEAQAHAAQAKGRDFQIAKITFVHCFS
jgi:DNA-binding transcriptional LysR family regulator